MKFNISLRYYINFCVAFSCADSTIVQRLNIDDPVKWIWQNDRTSDFRAERCSANWSNSDSRSVCISVPMSWQLPRWTGITPFAIPSFTAASRLEDRKWWCMEHGRSPLYFVYRRSVENLIRASTLGEAYLIHIATSLYAKGTDQLAFEILIFILCRQRTQI